MTNRLFVERFLIAVDEEDAGSAPAGYDRVRRLTVAPDGRPVVDVMSPNGVATQTSQRPEREVPTLTAGATGPRWDDTRQRPEREFSAGPWAYATGPKWDDTKRDRDRPQSVWRSPSASQL